MRGFELKTLLWKDWKVRKSFVGIFPSNKLPKFICSGVTSTFIFNIDPHYKPGSHWVALYISPFGDAIYFDSFGLPPLIPSIKHFIERNSRTFRYNKFPLQSLFSTTCGLYCVYFIRIMSKGGSLQDVLSNFDPQRQSFNDRRIRVLVSD